MIAARNAGSAPQMNHWRIAWNVSFVALSGWGGRDCLRPHRRMARCPLVKIRGRRLIPRDVALALLGKGGNGGCPSTARPPPPGVPLRANAGILFFFFFFLSGIDRQRSIAKPTRQAGLSLCSQAVSARHLRAAPAPVALARLRRPPFA